MKFFSVVRNDHLATMCPKEMVGLEIRLPESSHSLISAFEPQKNPSRTPFTNPIITPHKKRGVDEKG
jgi:hypothetical protein